MLRKVSILILFLFATLKFSPSCFASTPSIKELDKCLLKHTLVIVKDNQIKFYDDNEIKPLITEIMQLY